MEAVNKYLKIIIVAFLIIFSNCKSRKGNIYEIITIIGCYWDIHDSESKSYGRAAYCYKFEKDGNCKFLYTKDKNGKRLEFDFGDNLPVNTKWDIQGDTLIVMLGIKRIILSYSRDTLFLENPTNMENEILVKNCD